MLKHIAHTKRIKSKNPKKNRKIKIKNLNKKHFCLVHLKSDCMCCMKICKIAVKNISIIYLVTLVPLPSLFLSLLHSPCAAISVRTSTTQWCEWNVLREYFVLYIFHILCMHNPKEMPDRGGRHGREREKGWWRELEMLLKCRPTRWSMRFKLLNTARVKWHCTAQDFAHSYINNVTMYVRVGNRWD